MYYADIFMVIPEVTWLDVLFQVTWLEVLLYHKSYSVQWIFILPLYSEDTIERLLKNIFDVNEPPDWTVINGVAVILTALEKRYDR